jgi:curli biogenesis system outer membrane secretion channel CsgG
MRIPMAFAALAVLAVPAVADDDAASPTVTKKRLAIVQFETPYEYRNTRLAGGLTDMMITAMTKLGSFEIVERAQIDQILRERNLPAEGFVGPHTAAKLGELVGADMILGGKLTEFGVKTRKSGFIGTVGGVLGADLSTTTARAKIDCRLVETGSGRVVWADTGEATESRTGVSIAASDLHAWLAGIRLDSDEWSESRIGRAMRQAVDQVVEKLSVHYPPCGRIIGILDGDGAAGSSVVIDLGTFQDFKKGDSFTVFRERAVTNDVGEVIWTTRAKIGVVKIVEPRVDRSRAIVEAADPPVREGDTVICKALADKIAAEEEAGTAGGKKPER